MPVNFENFISTNNGVGCVGCCNREEERRVYSIVRNSSVEYQSQKNEHPANIKQLRIQYRHWSAHKLAKANQMIEHICVIITALAAVSREIREWIKLRKREKDDESHPPFLTLSFGTRFYTSQDNILTRVSLPPQSLYILNVVFSTFDYL